MYLRLDAKAASGSGERNASIGRVKLFSVKKDAAKSEGVGDTGGWDAVARRVRMYFGLDAKAADGIVGAGAKRVKLFSVARKDAGAGAGGGLIGGIAALGVVVLVGVGAVGWVSGFFFLVVRYVVRYCGSVGLFVVLVANFSLLDVLQKHMKNRNIIQAASPTKADSPPGKKRACITVRKKVSTPKMATPVMQPMSTLA
ncbi:hypothetical protein HK101_011935 [Irineochytrium annulatum]|nr:hypothetical protein HK101_011935 [Irineochytrium annulatum]